MKNAMKKLLSLVLVAMLLVSVLPLGAMAAEGDRYLVTFKAGTAPDAADAYSIYVTEGSTVAVASAADPGGVIYENYLPAVEAAAPEGQQFTGWSDGTTTYTTAEAVALTINAAKTFTPTYQAIVNNNPNPVNKYLVQFFDAQNQLVYGIYVEEGKTLAQASAADPVYHIEDYVKEANYNLSTGYRYVSGWEYNPHAVVTENKDYKIVQERIPSQFTLTFEANGGTFSGNERVTATLTESATPVSLSGYTVPTRSGYQFAGWYTHSSGGDHVTEVVMNGNKTVYAHWTDVDAVTVTAVYYKNGVRMNSAPLLTWTIPSGANAFDYVYNHKDDIRARVPSGYTWGVTSSQEDDYFYNYDNSEGLSAQNLTANGTKSVCVRFYSTSVNTAKVQLYVHTKVGGTATIYEMKDYGYGYVLGDEVTRSQVEYVVKKNYTGSNMTIQGLYSDASWTELCNGKSPTAASGVEVTNANFKVHVIVKNATTAKADTSNPKTGDAIFAPVAVLTLSTAALAAVYFISKKRVVR